MDNKQNRQFYWEVKDFLTRKQELVSKPTSSLRSTINEVTGSAKPVPVPVNEIVNSSQNTKNSVSRFLSAFENLKEKQMPNDPKRSKNITVNPFNLNESQKDDDYRWSAFFDSEADPEKGLRKAQKMNQLKDEDIDTFGYTKNLINTPVDFSTYWSSGMTPAEAGYELGDDAWNYRTTKVVHSSVVPGKKKVSTRKGSGKGAPWTKP